MITAQALQRSVSVKTKPEVSNLIPIAEPLIAVAREAIELYPPTTLANQELVAERNPLPTDLLTGSAEAGNSYTDNSQPGVTAVKFTRKIVSNQLQQKLQKANQALAENDSQQAKSLYRSMLTGGTEDKQARFGLAAIAINQQQFEEAQAHYRWILNIEPNNPFALAGLAEARTENSPQQKEAILKQQLAQQGEAHFLHYALGNSYVAQQRWGEAQQAYFKAFDLDPSNAVYAYNLAISLEQLQQTRSALGFYRRALQLIRAEDPLDRTVLSQRISQLEAK